MSKFYLFLFLLVSCTALTAQTPDIYSIPAWYLETDNTGNFYAAFGDKIFVFNEDGVVSDTIVSDFDEPFAKMVDFRIGRDGKMYLLYDFNNGIYEVDSTGHVTKVLNGRFRHFDVDDQGGILASIENGGENLLRYVNANLDTTFILDDSINASNLVFDVQIDKNNTFWVAYAKGILSVTNQELTRHNEESINDLFVGSDERIYVTYDIDRAGYKEPNQDEITTIHFDNAVGTRIAADNKGGIYVADDNIVYVLSDSVWSSVEISEDFFINPIDFVVDQNNTVVMSTSQGKMVIWKQKTTSNHAELKTKSLNIYPNPSSDFINFSNNNDQSFSGERYRIISADGTVVKTGILNGARIDIKFLPEGNYYIHFEEIGGAWKFVKI